MSFKQFDEDDFVSAISEAGQAFANDLNDGLDGYFGFSVGEYDEEADGYPLTASWQSVGEEDEDSEESELGPKQIQKFWLVPLTPYQHEGKHEA
jgi:hypothetical protein